MDTLNRVLFLASLPGKVVRVVAWQRDGGHKLTGGVCWLLQSHHTDVVLYRPVVIGLVYNGLTDSEVLLVEVSGVRVVVPQPGHGQPGQTAGGGGEDGGGRDEGAITRDAPPSSD